MWTEKEKCQDILPQEKQDKFAWHPTCIGGKKVYVYIIFIYVSLERHPRNFQRSDGQESDYLFTVFPFIT